MDPNESLRILRTWAHDTLNNVQDDPEASDYIAAEAFEALDEWIVKGGVLPAPWTQDPRF